MSFTDNPVSILLVENEEINCDQIKRVIEDPSQIKIRRHPLEGEKPLFDREEIKRFNEKKKDSNRPERDIIPKSLLNSTPHEAIVPQDFYYSLHKKVPSTRLCERFNLLKSEKLSSKEKSLKREVSHVSKSKESRSIKRHKSSHSKSCRRDGDNDQQKVKKLARQKSVQTKIPQPKVVIPPSSSFSRRSYTRSPTPIKYNCDIYQKRSPTFGRKCPVLNRRSHTLNSNDKANSYSYHTSNAENRNKSFRKVTNEPRGLDKKNRQVTIKSKITPSDIPRNPSYFQHDDRQADSSRSGIPNNGFLQSGSRKKWSSPARWQHDLFENEEVEGDSEK